MTEAVMCYDRSWFTSQNQEATTGDRKSDAKDERTKTVDALLRESNEQAKKVPTTAKETAPAK
jgi:hypothetical protein